MFKNVSHYFHHKLAIAVVHMFSNIIMPMIYTLLPQKTVLNIEVPAPSMNVFDQYGFLFFLVNTFKIMDNFLLTKWHEDVVFVSVRPVGFPSIFRRMHGRNARKSGMLMYPHHPHNWFNFCWWPKNLITFGFPVILNRTHVRNGLKCRMLMYHDRFQKWYDFGWYWPNYSLLVAKNLLLDL